MTMRILITGASSMLGKTTVRLLLQDGHEVTCFQRNQSDLPVRHILGDIREEFKVRYATKNQDAVIHLAALVKPKGHWDDFYSVNVDGTLNIIKNLNDSKKFVHISSPSVAFHNKPTVNEKALPANTHKGDNYTRSKALAEQLVLTSETPPTIILRPHLVWGPGDTQLVGRILAKADANKLFLPANGTALIDTTYVTNAAAAIVAALDVATPDNPALKTPLVVSNGEPRTVAEMVANILIAANRTPKWKKISPKLASLAGKITETLWMGEEPPITHFTARQLSIAHWYDQTATRKLLNWKPTVNIEEGFILLKEYFDNHTPKL